MFSEQLEAFYQQCERKLDAMPRLENYLLALLGEVEDIPEKTFSKESVIKVLGNSLTREPKPIEEPWSEIESSWTEDDVYSKDQCLGIIKRQISDLVWFRENDEPKDKWSYFGLKNRTGETWYNFHINNYFECASSALGSWEDKKVFKDGWSLLSFILLMGQTYE